MLARIGSFRQVQRALCIPKASYGAPAGYATESGGPGGLSWVGAARALVWSTQCCSLACGAKQSAAPANTILCFNNCVTASLVLQLKRVVSCHPLMQGAGPARLAIGPCRHFLTLLMLLPHPLLLLLPTIPCHSPAVYVVFGASGGIGSALSRRLLAQPGATVVVAGRDEAKLQQLVASIGGGECCCPHSTHVS